MAHSKCPMCLLFLQLSRSQGFLSLSLIYIYIYFLLFLCLLPTSSFKEKNVDYLKNMVPEFIIFTFSCLNSFEFAIPTFTRPLKVCLAWPHQMHFHHPIQNLPDTKICPFFFPFFPNNFLFAHLLKKKYLISYF